MLRQFLAFDKTERGSHAFDHSWSDGVTDPPSKTQIFLSRIALALLVGLTVVGIAWYGLSADELDRFWRNIVARPGGPMTFRFVLQPVMAAIAALRDGVNDARLGRMPYLYAIIHEVAARGDRLWEGRVSTARILILGVVMDVVYQVIFLGQFHPAESAFTAVLLVFVPYALLRGPFARVAGHWIAPPTSG
jgi:hypothetical protein